MENLNHLFFFIKGHNFYIENMPSVSFGGILVPVGWENNTTLRVIMCGKKPSTYEVKVICAGIESDISHFTVFSRLQKAIELTQSLSPEQQKIFNDYFNYQNLSGSPALSSEYFPQNNTTTTFFNAIHLNSYETVKKFLKEKIVSPNITDQNGRTALMKASSLGSLKIVKKLIKYSASVNNVDDFGFTALMFSANYGHEDIFSFLIQNGALVDFIDKIGRNVLFWALVGHNDSIFKSLSSNSTLTNNVDGFGFSIKNYIKYFESKVLGTDSNLQALTSISEQKQEPAITNISSNAEHNIQLKEKNDIPKEKNNIPSALPLNNFFLKIITPIDTVQISENRITPCPIKVELINFTGVVSNFFVYTELMDYSTKMQAISLNEVSGMNILSKTTTGERLSRIYGDIPTVNKLVAEFILVPFKSSTKTSYFLRFTSINNITVDSEPFF